METETIIEKTKGVVYDSLSPKSMQVTKYSTVILTDKRLILPVSDVSMDEALLGAIVPIYGIIKKVNKRIRENSPLEIGLKHITSVKIVRMICLFKDMPVIEVVFEKGKKAYVSVSKGWRINENYIEDFESKLKSAISAAK